ncbi:hypothetical protein F503_03526 [Ophiostoma piceae UAMH 11346]|uniref:Biogenesis of lysosome-related organelles complex 1 subunit CNL1 n=1 Tax=Ophiostoma piceae (strain UAMH 11346) TaxID=1262450 RepID=S3BT65_OPHP1|nr:hypothetical protein F503_03526 [Ophiostoma piceae UAMH 11346]
MPPSHAISVSQLNLTADELSRLRQGQEAVASRANESSSSRAASRASSQGALILDLRSLQSLEVYFNRVMGHIEEQIRNLSQQSLLASQAVADVSSLSVEQADAEIRRFQYINAQLDELELEFELTTNIREIVHQNRLQLEELDQEFEREAAHDEQHSRSHGHSSRHTSSRRREGHRDRASGRHGR